MNGTFVRISKDLSFEDLLNERVTSYDAYEKQVKAWIIEPARVLAEAKPRNTDTGMALLAVELLFFEAHGQYLTGESSQNKSRKTFCIAFDKFRDFLISEKMADESISDIDSVSVYRWARCGLFHSARLSKELLVDAVNYCSQPMAKNPLHGGWLINPWKLLEPLRFYVIKYVKLLKEKPDSIEAKKFQTTFNRLLIEPMSYFCSNDQKHL